MGRVVPLHQGRGQGHPREAGTPRPTQQRFPYPAEEPPLSLRERIDQVQQTALRLGLDADDPLLVVTRARKLALEAGELVRDACLACQLRRVAPPPAAY